MGILKVQILPLNSGAHLVIKNKNETLKEQNSFTCKLVNKFVLWKITCKNRYIKTYDNIILCVGNLF